MGWNLQTATTAVFTIILISAKLEEKILVNGKYRLVHIFVTWGQSEILKCEVYQE